MKHKLYIKSQLFNISWDNSSSNYASARTVEIEFDNTLFQLVIDERVNDIFPCTNKTYPQLKYIIQKYEDLKFSDFRYRTGDGYEGISLKLETFMEYLKQEDRDSQLNKILQC
jgi:hypothetical protein